MRLGHGRRQLRCPAWVLTWGVETCDQAPQLRVLRPVAALRLHFSCARWGRWYLPVGRGLCEDPMRRNHRSQASFRGWETSPHCPCLRRMCLQCSGTDSCGGE